MPRDPFFVSRAAEIAANIGMATLTDLGPGLFSRIDCNCQGETLAWTKTGASYRFSWDVTHQQLKLEERLPAPGELLVMELAA